jgi:alanyl-tRNA synthetase
MFEMLGNWSFGDYFKKEAIGWAWKLLVNVYKIDKNRLYFTVFEGDEQDGLEEDSEAYNIWLDILKENNLEESRILKCTKKDNFWEMGDSGPCGPCSEIHVDLRSDEERQKVNGRELVNKDHPQVIEIWNLVFMEFNRKADGSLEPLPNKHVDTGMGFERLAMVLQNKQSNYDTDIFSPLIQKLEQFSTKKYQASNSKQDIAFRVVADHIRAVAFAIADGQLPSNNGAGYVIRRILRRAVRYGYSFLNLNQPFMYALVHTLAQQMGDAFPEIIAQQELIKKVIKEEEESFLRTLEKGIARFNDYINSAKNKHIDGKFAFELYDTYGFPIDLTELMASENGFTVDMAEFSEELNKQKERSRKDAKIETEDWVILLEDDKEEFVGYDLLETDVKITRYRKIKTKGKDKYQLVLNVTPFYPEGGGQVGDTGYLQKGDVKITIEDTKKENNLIVHFTSALPDDLSGTWRAVVSESKRRLTAKNHSATHLLHQALREVLGTHVEQKGSLVNADYLRFDFSHFQKVTDQEIKEIEHLVNKRIRQNLPLDEKRNIPISEAEKMGAMMLFGEKYGDTVRVIRFGDSIELCGGTHVKATGEIGIFKIVSESATAAGIRRIEAITADKAEEFIDNELTTLREIKQILKNPQNVVQSVNDLLTKQSALEKEIQQLKREAAKNIKTELLQQITEINGIQVIAKKVAIDDNAIIKDLVFQLKNEAQNRAIILGAVINDKPVLTIGLSDDLVKEKGLNAGNIVRDAAKEIQGGGGGQPFFATAGGKNSNGVDLAIQKAVELLNK